MACWKPNQRVLLATGPHMQAMWKSSHWQLNGACNLPRSGASQKAFLWPFASFGVANCLYVKVGFHSS